MSGGLDSCVSSAMAQEKNRIFCLHVSYGQLTQERELKAFHDIADFYGVPRGDRMIVDIAYLKKIGGSSLTDKTLDIPKADLKRIGIPSTYVPFRNANILSIAVSWAEVIGAERIFIGAMEEDSSGYPDCRAGFFHEFNKAIKAGTRPGRNISIEAPLIHFTKAEVVKWGIDNGAPLHLTWSCYKSDGPAACGICDSCALRLRGFRIAGITDPIAYR